MDEQRGCHVESAGHVLLVTIDRPERRNALDAATNHELGRIFDDFEHDDRLRVAVITGSGSRAFCAGADLRQTGPVHPSGQVPPSGFAGLTDRFGRTKPVIAAVNGAAVGGGFEIALACDLVVAAEEAVFGLPEPKVGLVAMSGGIPRLVREIGPKRAHGIFLTGRHVSATEALHLGFVNQVVPQHDLLPAAQRWADLVLDCSPAAIRATKAIADACDGRGVQATMAIQAELPGVEGLLDGPDASEGRAAFVERRAPRWTA